MKWLAAGVVGLMGLTAETRPRIGSPRSPR